MKNKSKEKIRLEDGIYRVRLYRVDENINYSLDLLKKNPFIENNSLYIHHDIVPKFLGSSFFDKDQILIKYDSKKDFVTEFKTGLEIPIVYFCSDSVKNKKSKVIAPGFEKNKFPIICVGISFKKYKIPLAIYNEHKKVFKKCEKVIDEQSFEGSISSFNLLNLSSNSLDEMVEEYNRIYSDDEVFKENILRPINELNEKKQEEVKRAKERELKKLKEEENKKAQTKRNYEKYYYVDSNVKKGNRKRLFRK